MMEDLYQEVILDSSQCTRNRGDLSACASATHELVRNPLCGDSIDLWLDVQDGRVRDVKFSGQGCAISQAAASLVADLVKDKSFDELPQLVSDVQLLLSGDADEDCRDRLGQLVALEGVRRFPIRMRCAMLAVEALRRLIAPKDA